MADDPIIDSLNPFPERDDETAREARIRRRAYELWEAAGRPEGREQEHWYMAESEEGVRDDPAPIATPITPAEGIPAIRSPGGAGVPGAQHDRMRMDPYEAPEAPKTAGAAEPAPDISKSPVANRDLEGPRKASTTPRPTRKPLAGS